MIRGIPLAIVLAIIILLFYAMDFYFMFRYDPQRRQRGKGWAWDYTLLTAAMGVAVLLQPVVLPRIAFSVDHAWGAVIQLLGGMSVALSFGLHIWARVHLRYFYTERVEVQSDHRVIDTGPYALMRHPIIVSFFLIAVGVFLLNPAVTTLLVLVYVILDFSKAAGQEEALLKESIPGYVAYMRRTPRFIPRLWRGQ